MAKLNFGESHIIEFKESWHDEYLRWICGFANAHGGILYIGINDEREIVGIKNAKKLMEDIPNKVSMSMGILVDVNLHKESRLEYLSIDVKPSVSPVGCKGKFYYRSGSTNQELTGIALENFLLGKNNHTWDSLPIDGTSMSDIDPESVDYFVRRGIRFGRLPASTLGLSPERILSNLNLIAVDGRMTHAALLLFGNKPQSYFVGTLFRIGRFRDSESNILYQDEVAGNLIHMPDAVLDLLKGKYLISLIRFEGLQRIEELEIPEEALREILCNSIVHKDYRGVHTQMKVYDDHIRLWNEGGLIDGMTIESLRKEHNSCPRNKLIAQVFYLAGFIETWGRGIQKVDNAFTKAGLDIPEYEESCGGIVTIIPRQTPTTIGSTKNPKDDYNGVLSELTERQLEIFLLVKSDCTITSQKISQKISQKNQATTRTIIKDMKRLQDLGIICRIGGRKEGYWEILIP